MPGSVRLIHRFDELWRPRRLGQILILDNRDSFVFNLAHRFAEIGERCAVVRSDSVTLKDIRDWQPSALVVSPGPGRPEEAGVSVEAIREFAPQIPILGVCLGHQAIASAFGGLVEESGRPIHGKVSPVRHDSTGVFHGLEDGLIAARYHSLVVTRTPEEMVENAWADDFIMGFRHHSLPIHGVQFHPESILTKSGYKILKNFIDLKV